MIQCLKKRFNPRPVAPPTESECHIRRDWLLDTKRLLGGCCNGIVIDGGAFKGDVADRMSRVFSNQQIHAFEPNGELFESMKSRFADNQRIVCHHAALSSQEGTATFHVTARPDCASLYQPGQPAKQWHPEAMGFDRNEEVETVRMDTLFSGQSIDLMKLDLQGYELEALRGAGSVLKQTKVIVAEVSFVEFYSGQPLFCQVSEYLRQHHFRLFYLSDVWLRPEGQITQADAMFVNEKHFPSIA
ncbi:2-O-methyltransferase NoeI [Novipirellula aureliae]|uniref:2-O-methyltransferase NoeI n=1 Tax=Novipirellula aureliae TaxID=2527966 RepID=A0A5C6DYK4_9BACT|nr:FkbM family methyltransferase [Novipirellula aureliae]TWU41304.1 2-O-methyltransferase NoeI [Novipirellula aureliae]